MSTLSHVCFYEWAEWHVLYNKIFNSTSTAITTASNAATTTSTASTKERILLESSILAKTNIINKLVMWENRNYMPLYIKSTYSIVTILLKIEKFKLLTLNNINNNDYIAYMNTIRNEGSLVLIKFVNNIVDLLQKSKYAQSINHLAQSVDLPTIFVDIRHTSTHGDLLSYNVIVLAIDAALLYLKSQYWDVQYHDLIRIGGEDIFKSELEFKNEVFTINVFETKILYYLAHINMPVKNCDFVKILKKNISLISNFTIAFKNIFLNDATKVIAENIEIDEKFTHLLLKWSSLLDFFHLNFPSFIAILFHELLCIFASPENLFANISESTCSIALKLCIHCLNDKMLSSFHSIVSGIRLPAISYLDLICSNLNKWSIHLLNPILNYCKIYELDVKLLFSCYNSKINSNYFATNLLPIRFINWLPSNLTGQYVTLSFVISNHINQLDLEKLDNLSLNSILKNLFCIFFYLESPTNIFTELDTDSLNYLNSLFSSQLVNTFLSIMKSNKNIPLISNGKSYLEKLFLSSANRNNISPSDVEGILNLKKENLISIDSKKLDDFKIKSNWKICNDWDLCQLGKLPFDKTPFDPNFNLPTPFINFESNLKNDLPLSLTKSKPIIPKLDFKNYSKSNPFSSIYELLPNEYLSSSGPYVRVSTFISGSVNNLQDYSEQLDEDRDDEYFSSDAENIVEPNSKFRKYDNLEEKVDNQDELDIILF